MWGWLRCGKLLRTLTGVWYLSLPTWTSASQHFLCSRLRCGAFFLSATRGHQCPAHVGFDTWLVDPVLQPYGHCLLGAQRQSWGTILVPLVFLYGHHLGHFRPGLVLCWGKDLGLGWDEVCSEPPRLWKEVRKLWSCDILWYSFD